MKKNIFVLCDLEALYTSRLMEYICEKQERGFEVQGFTSVEKLCAFAKEQKINLLLISSQAMCEEIKELSIGQIMLLSEGEMGEEEVAEYPILYKYQSAETLLAEVMRFYAEETSVSPKIFRNKDVEILGVYSPIGEPQKSSFALTLGQILSKERKVLYISLESYAGFEGLMEEELQSDLSELMYFAKQENGNLVYKLNGMVHHIGSLDYIPPSFSPQDIRSVLLEEWRYLWEQIRLYTTYNTVIIEFGEQPQALYDLLNECDCIYMPIREDAISIARLGQYEQVLSVEGYEAVLGKTKKLNLPTQEAVVYEKDYLNKLLWGEMGAFVRTLICEGKEG